MKRLGCWGSTAPVSWDQTLLLQRCFTLMSSVLQEKFWSWFMVLTKREGSVTYSLSLGALAVWDESQQCFSGFVYFLIAFCKELTPVWFCVGRFPHGECRETLLKQKLKLREKLVNENRNLAVEIQAILSLLWQPGPQLVFGGRWSEYSNVSGLSGWIFAVSCCFLLFPYDSRIAQRCLNILNASGPCSSRREIKTIF